MWQIPCSGSCSSMELLSSSRYIFIYLFIYLLYFSCIKSRATVCKERSICLGSQEERQENAGQWSICGVLHIKHAALGWLYSDRRALWFQLIDYRRFYSQPSPLNMEFTQIITNHIVFSLSIFPATDHIIWGIQLWIIETGWNPVWHSAIMACHWICFIICTSIYKS